VLGAEAGLGGPCEILHPFPKGRHPLLGKAGSSPGPFPTLPWRNKSPSWGVVEVCPGRGTSLGSFKPSVQRRKVEQWFFGE
jgi:hypothetical protein